MSQSAFWHQDASYTLRSLELYNWGGFNGYHQAEVDPHGTAVIGPTGSGKTTLVDALMTLLCAQPRYNLASTGGHESDRDLVSYVRGVSGPGKGEQSQQHIARTGKTLTGITATLSNGEEQIRLGALLWFDDTSSATTDMKRLWFFATAPEQTLEYWLSLQHEGGMRALRQLDKTSTGIWTYPAKKEYLARIRSFFEVRDNAFTLLNRAAGLKQLNSIDEIFRELVLDDTSAFERAAEVAASFDDLSDIHQELEIARQQQRSLEPVKAHWQKYQAHQQTLAEQTRLERVLPIWFAGQAADIWQRQADTLRQAIRSAQAAKGESERQKHQQAEVCDRLKEAYMQHGGTNIEQLRQLIAAQQQEVRRREQGAEDYQRLARRLSLPETLDEAAFSANQQQLGEQQQAFSKALHEAKEQAFAAGVTAKQHAEALGSIQADLAEVEQRPGSNIRPEYQVFRAELAEHLALAEDQLPFVAELVQVKEAEQGWRGAIERAIGSHRLRILVPPEVAQAALHWINQRHNRLHVRIWEVPHSPGPARFLEDGFCRKLDYKSHPYREALKAFIARGDRHCVDSVEQLHHTEHAMTIKGLMSAKGRVFDKQDHKRLNQDWQTGFDNRDRLAGLQAQLHEARQHQQQLKARLEQVRAQEQTLVQQGRLIESLLALRFEQIDAEPVRQQLREQEQRLAHLLDPNSDIAALKRQHEAAQAQYKQLEQQHEQNIEQVHKLKPELERAERKQAEAFKVAGAGLDEEDHGFAARYLPVIRDDQISTLAQLQRQHQDEVQKAVAELEHTLAQLALELVRDMERAQKQDRGALADVGTELEDAPQYLQRLEQLTEEALPEKRQRFMQYLARSSDEGVTQLLSHIDNEVALIEERLEDVNTTLRRTDFQQGRYLQLVASKVVHESLRSLSRAKQQLASARFKDDEGESQYRALQQLVAQLRDACERRRTLAARALLDPRFRIEFRVAVIDRASGETLSIFKGSQSGSGGEKEIIASYVLTASLSYALCPDASRQPLFASIVLDEAFSRSSHTVAGRIIAALQEFGLHALFITPNKEMRLLRKHTRSAIVVHRRGQASSLASLSWQALEDLKPQTAGPVHEIAG